MAIVAPEYHVYVLRPDVITVALPCLLKSFFRGMNATRVSQCFE